MQLTQPKVTDLFAR